MPSLVLGPMLRHAGRTDATVWVETDAACTVEVLGHEAQTFRVGAHHYALVIVDDLEPGTVTPYEVALDGERVWPRDDGFPPSAIRTISDGPMDVVFGSCRVAYPHRPPYSLTKDEDPQGREVCALRALALALTEVPAAQRPGALILLGDQIYADEVEPDTLEYLRRRRDTDVPPGAELSNFEEYTHAYAVSWGEPAMRWLLSTVPSAMIFDDHDVIDDWNTSQDWVADIRANGWWDERILGAFVSYWIYQHLGNLSPTALADDDLWAAVRAADDAEGLLREFAFKADREVDSVRWSFCRDLGPARLIMVDSRGGRVLDPERRDMVDDDEWAFIEENAAIGEHRHLLIGSSLPWLLAPGMHHLEAFNEAVSSGAWGRTVGRVGEKVRRAVDMEHWAAFNRSWHHLTRVIQDVGTPDGQGEPPATIIALGGDVHHAYLAEVAFRRDAGVRSRVYQAVCSPFRNPLDARERRVIRAASSRAFGAVASRLARAAGVQDPELRWRLREPPVFDNVVATLQLDGASATMRIDRARPTTGGTRVRLEQAFHGAL